MQVEILYFADCPNHLPAVQRVEEVLRQEGLAAEIRQVEVPDAESAQQLHFLGSPSIRVNGQDVDPRARACQDFGMMCRTGLPSHDLIRSAIRLSQEL